MSVKTTIIVADWDRYPLFREKTVGNRSIKCGMRPLLNGIKTRREDSDFEVLLVVNTESADIEKVRQKYSSLLNDFKFISNIHIRGNYAMDIGAYDYGYKICLQNNFRGRIMFINSSVCGPHSDNWLHKYEELFQSIPRIGLSGATVNMIPARGSGTSTLEHVQSWLLYSDMGILKNCFGDSLLSDSASFRTKNDVIYYGEIAISQKIINKGYGINCMAFPELCFFKGESWSYPFQLGWRSHNKELQCFMNTTIV